MTTQTIHATRLRRETRRSCDLWQQPRSWKAISGFSTASLGASRTLKCRAGLAMWRTSPSLRIWTEISDHPLHLLERVPRITRRTTSQSRAVQDVGGQQGHWVQWTTATDEPDAADARHQLVDPLSEQCEQ